jgi:hypothetical protein
MQPLDKVPPFHLVVDGKSSVHLLLHCIDLLPSCGGRRVGGLAGQEHPKKEPKLNKETSTNVTDSLTNNNKKRVSSPCPTNSVASISTYTFRFRCFFAAQNKQDPPPGGESSLLPKKVASPLVVLSAIPFTPVTHPRTHQARSDGGKFSEVKVSLSLCHDWLMDERGQWKVYTATRTAWKDSWKESREGLLLCNRTMFYWRRVERKGRDDDVTQHKDRQEKRKR